MSYKPIDVKVDFRPTPSRKRWRRGAKVGCGTLMLTLWSCAQPRPSNTESPTSGETSPGLALMPIRRWYHVKIGRTAAAKIHKTTVIATHGKKPDFQGKTPDCIMAAVSAGGEMIWIHK
ncbi:hypothetical protein ACJZ2D_008118 [Fusarium nematophilum]